MRSRSRSGRGVARVLVGLAAGGVLAAVVAVVGPQHAEPAEAAARVTAPTTVVAPPVVVAAPAPTTSATPTPAPRSECG